MMATAVQPRTMTRSTDSSIGDNNESFQSFNGHYPLHYQHQELDDNILEKGDKNDDTDNLSTCTNPRLKKLMDRYFPTNGEDCDADGEYNVHETNDHFHSEAKFSERSRRRRLKRRRNRRILVNQSAGEDSDDDFVIKQPVLFLNDEPHLSPMLHTSSNNIPSSIPSLDLMDLDIECCNSVVTKVDFVEQRSPFLSLTTKPIMNDDISDVARYFNFSLSDHNDSISDAVYPNHAIEFEADILADIELTERARQMQHDLRLREMEELAAEAEKAAEAGDEKFVGSATKFGGDTCISSLPSFITNHSMVPIARNSIIQSRSHEKTNNNEKDDVSNHPGILQRSHSCIEIRGQDDTPLLKEPSIALPPSVKRLSSERVIEKPTRIMLSDRNLSAPALPTNSDILTTPKSNTLSPIRDRVFTPSSSSSHSELDRIGHISSAPSKLNQGGRQDHFLQVQTTFSATFTASSFLSPSFQVKRIRVLSLRHIEEVIPSFCEMHQQLNTHLKRSGAKFFCELTSGDIENDQEEKHRRGSFTGLASLLPRPPSLQNIFSNISGTNKDTEHSRVITHNSADTSFNGVSNHALVFDADESFDCASLVSCSDVELAQQIVITPVKKCEKKIGNNENQSESVIVDCPKMSYMNVLASELRPDGFYRSPSPLPSAPYEFDKDESDVEPIILSQQQACTSSPWTKFWKNISPSKKNIFLPTPSKLSRSSTTGSLPWMIALAKNETTINGEENSNIPHSSISPRILTKRTSILSSRSLPSPFTVPEDNNAQVTIYSTDEHKDNDKDSNVYQQTIDNENENEIASLSSGVECECDSSNHDFHQSHCGVSRETKHEFKLSSGAEKTISGRITLSNISSNCDHYSNDESGNESEHVNSISDTFRNINHQSQLSNENKSSMKDIVKSDFSSLRMRTIRSPHWSSTWVNQCLQAESKGESSFYSTIDKQQSPSEPTDESNGKESESFLNSQDEPFLSCHNSLSEISNTQIRSDSNDSGDHSTKEKVSGISSKLSLISDKPPLHPKQANSWNLFNNQFSSDKLMSKKRILDESDTDRKFTIEQIQRNSIDTEDNTSKQDRTNQQNKTAPLRNTLEVENLSDIEHNAMLPFESLNTLAQPHNCFTSLDENDKKNEVLASESSFTSQQSYYFRDESTYDGSPNKIISEKHSGVDPNNSIGSTSRFIDFMEKVPTVMDRLSPLLPHTNFHKKKEEYEDDIAFVGNYFYVAEDTKAETEFFNVAHKNESEHVLLCGRQKCNETGCTDIGLSVIEAILTEENPPNLTLNDTSPERVQCAQGVFSPCTGGVVNQHVRGRVKAGNRFYSAPSLQVKKGGIFSGMGSHDFDEELEPNLSEDNKPPTYLSTHQESSISPVHEGPNLLVHNGIEKVEVFPTQDHTLRRKRSKHAMVESCKSLLSFSDEELPLDQARIRGK